MPSTDGTLFTLSDNTPDNRLKVFRSGSNSLNLLFETNNGSVTTTSINNAPNDNEAFKLAIKYENDSTIKISTNGDTTQTFTGTYSKTFNRLFLGSNYNGGGNYWNSHIKSAVHLSKAISDTALEFASSQTALTI
jgi:hypothetical protein